MTKNHIVFVAGPQGRIDKPAGAVHVGEKVFAVIDDAIVESTVVQIHSRSSSRGMFAPLTQTGTVVVDGVVASNYALPDLSLKLPHSVAHFVLFPVRMYHSLGFSYILETLCKFTSSELLP